MTTMSLKIGSGKKARNVKYEARKNLKDERRKSARKTNQKKSLKKILMNIRPVSAAERRKKKKRRKLSRLQHLQRHQLLSSRTCLLLKKFAALLI